MIPSRPTSSRTHPLRRGLVTALGLALLLTSAAPAEARKCSAKSVKKIKLLNRDAVDELDRWKLVKARRHLSDAVLVAKARGCLKSAALAQTYIILGVVESRNRKWKATVKAWHKALCIASWVLLPKRLMSPKLVRVFRRARATRKCKSPSARRPPRTDPRVRNRPDPRPRPRPAGPPKRFDHINPGKHRLGQHLTLRVRVADKLKVKRVRIFYKAGPKAKLKSSEFRKGGGDRWTWYWRINGVHLYVKSFHYFIVAYAAGDRPVAAVGNAMQLNRIKIVK